MSALSARRVKGTARTTRLRKVHCVECDYKVLMSRVWMAVALPPCPNPDCKLYGTPMSPADLGDAVELGMVTLDELPRPVRTALCRRMGWEDEIVRTSPSQAPGAKRRKPLRVAEVPF